MSAADVCACYFVLKGEEKNKRKNNKKQLEDMFMSFMATELGFVEQLGGILGAMVGCLQSLMYLAQGDPTT